LKKIIKIGLKAILIFSLVLLVSFGGFYGYWNAASPEKTCLSCHEISASFNHWQNSAHREINCKECHGTVLSNGIHSLKEKADMVSSHLSDENIENIKLDEAQIVETMERCIKCHQTEYSNWKASGHSAKYSDIFLDKKHNSTERLNFDCLRCHGMFFNGTVEDLVEPIDTKGPWKLKNQEISGHPTIPCMACHQIHSEGMPEKFPDYSNPAAIQSKRNQTSAIAGFYNRPDANFFRADFLPEAKIFEKERIIQVSDDRRQRVCIQCHAPNSWHQSGSSDDRTPTGVHEGISCLACHANHSNKSENSCSTCHPAMSNCGIEVETMNTSYKDPKSTNNIHFVKCSDCHKENIEQLKMRQEKKETASKNTN
jgi:hypothetical protein